MSKPMQLLTLDMAANITRTHGRDTLRALAADRLAVVVEDAISYLRTLHPECLTDAEHCPTMAQINQLEHALAEWRAAR